MYWETVELLDMVFSSTKIVVKMWRQEHVAQQKETSAITGWLLSFLMPAFQMVFENKIIETPHTFCPSKLCWVIEVTSMLRIEGNIKMNHEVNEYLDAFSSLCLHQTVAKMVQELYNYVDADLSIMLRLMDTHTLHCDSW